MGVIKAPPDNLGARQQALNSRVNEAAASNVSFDTVKDTPEHSEVDRLFKIDVAAKYKNLPYIIEILKLGDSLYTSRALKKCQWLYSDEYSHIINPKYLQENIFPLTSMKMKRKIVKTAAAQITTPERAIEFFHYCMKEKMRNTAFNCLLYTTEEFKLDQLRNNKDASFKALEEKDILYYRFFVGKSFALLDVLLGFISINWKISKTARQFKNFFSESEEKYLDIAEKYVSVYYGFQTDKFGAKLSDAIMKRHKHRVLSKPEFYVNTVDTDVLVRNSNVEDAKIYAKALLPDKAKRFWELHHYTIFKSVFKIIPHDETYAFFKNFFAENYPGEEFEMHPEFYNQEYHKFMSFDEREQWALNQLKNEKQMLGVGRDYIWYKFISFEVAFEEIKRYVSLTQDADKRNEIVQVLIESARNNLELEMVFKYYSKRHMKELRKYKENFLSRTLSHHNVFEFDDACWAAFNTIMHSLVQSYSEEEDVSEHSKQQSINYKTIALLYNIVQKKEMPEDLEKFLDEEFYIQYIETYLSNIIDEKQQILHEYFYNFYMNIITRSKNETFEYHVYQNELKPKWERHFENITSSMKLFNENGEVHENISDQQPKKQRYIDPYEISERSLIRHLKKDKNLVINKLPNVQAEFEIGSIKINTFLKKIKIYFPDDVTPLYLGMFQKLSLNESLEINHTIRSYKHVANAVRTGVNAVFQLADQDDKIDFMKKYQPEGTKTDRKSLGKQHLLIQRGICRYACISRPPVPLSSMIMYMKGDYVKNCLHIFNTYLALLPLPMCQEFVYHVIDAPVSIQKHAIRLAFQCFNTNSLKEAILNIWKSTKNVSLRGIIYKAFYNKVVDTQENDFYDVLDSLTRELSQEDEASLFDTTVSDSNRLPDEFLGDYIATVWQTINKFKDIEPNITRKTRVIEYMCENINLVEEEFASTVVNGHVQMMILENKLEITYSEEDIAALYKEKWSFIAHYVLHYPCPSYAQSKYIQLAQYIIRKNIENWDKMAYGIYVYQQCTWDFFTNLKKISLAEEYANFEETIPIFDGILKVVEIDLQFYDNYLLIWELKLLLITANVMNQKRNRCIATKELDIVTESLKIFGEEVGKLVSEFVENNKYFISFSQKIKEKVRDYAEELLKLIYGEIYEGHDWKWKEHLYTALIILAANIVQFQLAETYLLAIKLVPTDCKECASDTFKWLINKFQEFPNGEVQLALYQKLQKYCDRKFTLLKSSTPCHIN